LLAAFVVFLLGRALQVLGVGVRLYGMDPASAR
jgi:hypothetical protein